MPSYRNWKRITFSLQSRYCKTVTSVVIGITLARRCGHVSSFMSCAPPGKVPLFARDSSSSTVPLLLRIAALSFTIHCTSVASPFTLLWSTDTTTQRLYQQLFIDCTIILRRASTNAFATNKANRDTSETYRPSASRSIAKHYNTLRASHTDLIAPHIIHNGSRACPS